MDLILLVMLQESTKTYLNLFKQGIFKMLLMPKIMCYRN